VKLIQRWLNQLLPGRTLPIDGIFDDKTLEAAVDYQTANKLRVDGLVGRQTWGALCRAAGHRKRRRADRSAGVARAGSSPRPGNARSSLDPTQMEADMDRAIQRDADESATAARTAGAWATLVELTHGEDLVLRALFANAGRIVPRPALALFSDTPRPMGNVARNVTGLRARLLAAGASSQCVVALSGIGVVLHGRRERPARRWRGADDQGGASAHPKLDGICAGRSAAIGPCFLFTATEEYKASAWMRPAHGSCLRLPLNSFSDDRPRISYAPAHIDTPSGEVLTAFVTIEQEFPVLESWISNPAMRLAVNDAEAVAPGVNLGIGVLEPGALPMGKPDADAATAVRLAHLIRERAQVGTPTAIALADDARAFVQQYPEASPILFDPQAGPAEFVPFSGPRYAPPTHLLVDEVHRGAEVFRLAVLYAVMHELGIVAEPPSIEQRAEFSWARVARTWHGELQMERHREPAALKLEGAIALSDGRVRREQGYVRPGPTIGPPLSWLVVTAETSDSVRRIRLAGAQIELLASLLRFKP
jgi:Putative peptidoglycan binding domain